jgi:hypothetical protein
MISSHHEREGAALCELFKPFELFELLEPFERPGKEGL